MKLVKRPERKREKYREGERVDWRVDAGKRRTGERIVHGNEKDLGARGGTELLVTRI